MSKVGSQLIQAAEEALAFARGELKPGYRELDPSRGPAPMADTSQGAGPYVHRFMKPDPTDTRHLRKSMGLSRQRFADIFGFAVDDLREWEMDLRAPQGSALAFLKVIARNPDEALRALGQIPEALQRGAPAPAPQGERAVEPAETGARGSFAKDKGIGGRPGRKMRGPWTPENPPASEPENQDRPTSPRRRQ